MYHIPPIFKNIFIIDEVMIFSIEIYNAVANQWYYWCF